MKLLIADDNPINLSVLQELLVAEDRQILLAEGGAEALKLARTEYPDLILLDIRMPEIDGWQVCESLQADAATRDIPIVIITCLTEPEEKIRAFEAGAVDYVTRPFDPAEVAARVDTHLTLKRVREELELKARQLEERNRALEEIMRQKDEILYIATQEIRNPLSAILGVLALEEESLGEVAEDISHSAKIILKIIENLSKAERAISKSSDDEPRPVNLAELLRSTAECHLHQARRKNQRFELELEENCVAMVDAHRLWEILENFVTNAVKFSPADATITLRLRRETDHFFLGVSDEGPGLSKVDFGKVFRKYERLSAKPTHKEPSTGLGLFIAKVFAGLLNGEVGVTNNDSGVGATFFVRIPIGELPEFLGHADPK
ncbi:Hybrid sensor histidine kinase/response regulator [Sulfidibacter corallicola]|uniref:histidine kinase n=1 Tax=Sulfidibacter corallicola TaxID=2818388 RepID=A0A8A4TDX3_SULCO|nr:hybrid sensor histidine kinase/response regulator [Sulfidibacter corallicola]QTD47843.1 hybrid sensor histidine kinase/response regulator [Sulfidibacter corallicola]